MSYLFRRSSEDSFAMLRLLLYFTLFAVVKHCPRLCGRGRDYGVVVERELAHFLRGLMRFIYPVTSIPAVDDVIAMWLSYPHWSRCAQLRQVVNLVLSVVVVSSYQAEFVDNAATALDPDELASSLHLVRSWFGHSFVGKSRRDLRGLMRIAETTDMQVSRLSDSVRAKPWDQLLKVGLDQSLSFCVALLDKGPEAPVVPIVDEYRSSILAQLNVMEVMTASPIRVSPKLTALPSGSGSKSKRPRSQSDVKMKTPNKDANVVASTISKSAILSKTRGVIRTCGVVGGKRRRLQVSF